MIEVIDRPPVGGSGLPPLPPYLRKRREEPGRRVFILPNLKLVETRTVIRDLDNNWQTIIYQWMNRVIGPSLFDEESIWETAHVQTRAYKQWLETFTMPDGVPPHIGLVGAINKTEKDDPTFHERWKDYARRTFC